jgi:hypothetical protein
VPDITDSVWVVNFGSGGGYFIAKTEPSYVRCVR